jgi:hypothetical protein
MYAIKYTDNWNGKLLCDTWPDVRIPFAEFTTIGNILKVEHETIGFLGYARVLSCKPFTYGHITDNMSYSVTGKPRAYLKKMLTDFYEGMKEDTKLVHVILSFTERNPATLHKLIEKQYNKMLSITPKAHAYADGSHQD